MRRIVSTVVAIAALGMGSAHGYSNLFAFGDSLTDGGNAFALAPPSAALQFGWPPSPPANQRFTNGLTAAEQLAPLLGLPALVRSSADGSNYAVGGAMTGMFNFNALVQSPLGLPPGVTTTGMQSQIASFLGTAPTISSDSLFFLWGGPNDIFFALGTGGDPGVAVATAVNNLAGIVGSLAAAGARQFVVLNMPDLGLTPGGAASSNPAGLTAITQGFNALLDGTLMTLEMNNSDLEITVFNTFALLNDVTLHPGAYGLTNVTSACLSSLSALAGGCAGYLYFDDGHPTKLTHAILANALNVALVPEPGTWAMLAVGLLALFGVARRRVGR